MKNFFEKVLCLTQCYRWERRCFSHFGQKNKTDLSKLTDRFFAVPRRGASCYLIERFVRLKPELLSPVGARVVTSNSSMTNTEPFVAVPRRGASCYTEKSAITKACKVAVPRRGASCYGKNAKNTMRIFGIPTIFLYYLLYFCVSIRDIVGFPRCEPACNNLIYCYYNTRFAPNQPVSKPSSIATGCKTQRHKL